MRRISLAGCDPSAIFISSHLTSSLFFFFFFLKLRCRKAREDQFALIRSVCIDLWWTTRIGLSQRNSEAEDEEDRCNSCLQFFFFFSSLCFDSVYKNQKKTKTKRSVPLISGGPRPEKTDQTSPSPLITGTGKERSVVAVHCCRHRLRGRRKFEQITPAQVSGSVTEL